MRLFNRFSLLAGIATCVLPSLAHAQTAPNLAVLRGLAPFDQLLATAPGRAALAANYRVTGDIQSGRAHQPLLLSFPAQQAQALRDAFITGSDASNLADGLGSTLGAAYQARANFTSTDDGQTYRATSLTPSLAALISYTTSLTEADAGAGKYFFASGTINGSTPASDAAYPLLLGGSVSVYDTYPHPNPGGAACTTIRSDRGDSRPLLTLKTLTLFEAADYFGVKQTSLNYLCGPTDNEQRSPSFPSGHSTYAYTEALLLGYMVPERFPQMVVRAGEYGNDRIVLGAHYAMDIIAGRTLSLYDLAHLLANDPQYLGLTLKGHDSIPAPEQPVSDFQAALASAQTDARAALEQQTGMSVGAAADKDDSRFSHPAAMLKFYEYTMNYGLPAVYPAQAGHEEDVLTRAPEAGYLLTTAYPQLSLVQADDILTQTEAPGGGFLDNGSEFGIYSRLDLYRAALRARALIATQTQK
jgi:hypothetical protein